MAIVLPLFSRPAAPTRSSGWTNQELAELYRVQHALGQASVSVETDQGVTDEGDPWFVFCRPDGEVLVHIARYDGLYHLFSPALAEPLSGPTFSVLTRAFTATPPMSPKKAADSRVVLHPSALLSLAVLTIFFAYDLLTGTSGRAAAGETDDHASATKTASSTKETAARAVAVGILGTIVTTEALRAEEINWIAAQAAVLAAMAGLFDDATFGATPIAVADADATPQVWDASAGARGGSIVQDLASPEARPSSVSKMGATVDDPVASTTQTVSTTAADPHGSPTAATALPLVATAGAPSRDRIQTTSTSPHVTGGPGEVTRPVETGNVARYALTVGSGNGVLDLQGVAADCVIELSGNGSLTITGLTGDGKQTIVVTDGSVETLHLNYVVSSSDADLKQTIVVADGSSISLAAVTVDGTTDTTRLELTIDSTGSGTNTVNLSTGISTSTKLDLKIIGSQDIVVNETASTLVSSSLDASGLDGQLTVGIDLSGSSHLTTLVGASNFVVNDDGIIVLMNVHDGSKIQIGTDLHTVVTQFDGTSGASSLEIDLLSTKSTPTSVTVDVLKFDGVTDLVLTSGGGSTVTNVVTNVIASSLSLLTISGDASLTIGDVVGVTASDTQNITIDASGLTGALHLDASGIADTTAGGRLVALVGGSGDDVLTDTSTTEVVTFTGGAGSDLFVLGAGMKTVTITDLSAVDTVRIGEGSATDVVVDATALSGVNPKYFDGLSLVGAATEAAALAGSTVAHQAVLFMRGGQNYVFVDADGDHRFDANADVIVHLIGTFVASDLTEIFQST